MCVCVLVLHQFQKYFLSRRDQVSVVGADFENFCRKNKSGVDGQLSSEEAVARGRGGGYALGKTLGTTSEKSLYSDSMQ